MKIRAEMNVMEMIKTIEKINETKSWFFEKVNKNKPLARLIKRERTQIRKIRNGKEVAIDTKKLHKIIRDYYKQLYASKSTV